MKNKQSLSYKLNIKRSFWISNLLFMYFSQIRMRTARNRLVTAKLMSKKYFVIKIKFNISTIWFEHSCKKITVMWYKK